MSLDSNLVSKIEVSNHLVSLRKETLFGEI